ncbi:hypothetical protein [Nonomuraea sp. NPDC050786]|uniref:hypothetical protein n=1 Tax=Nonomuraea sp. NPDC050786 TaxID=3154840 RepID=UPI0033E04ABC
MNSREPFDDLEAELLALGDLLDVPSPPPADVAASVRARLEAEAHDASDSPPTGATAPTDATLPTGRAPSTGAAPPDAAPTDAAAPSPADGTSTVDGALRSGAVPSTGAPPPTGAVPPVGGGRAGGDAGEGGEPGEGPDPAHDALRPHPPAPGRRDDGRRPPARRGRRARWKIITAVVLVVVAITAATPQGRAAVVRILRFAGIELRIGETIPPPVTTTAPMPGEHTVPPDQARGQVKFQVKTVKALGDPKSVTVADNGRVVSMFWPNGVRLDQFDGSLDPVFFKKLGPPWPDYAKVGPYEAWWVPGKHPLGYILRQDGTEVPLRQAGPTLIWQQHAVNYRLEGLKTKEEAIRIATSLR